MSDTTIRRPLPTNADAVVSSVKRGGYRTRQPEGTYSRACPSRFAYSMRINGGEPGSHDFVHRIYPVAVVGGAEGADDGAAHRVLDTEEHLAVDRAVLTRGDVYLERSLFRKLVPATPGASYATVTGSRVPSSRRARALAAVRRGERGQRGQRSRTRSSQRAIGDW